MILNAEDTLPAEIWDSRLGPVFWEKFMATYPMELFDEDKKHIQHYLFMRFSALSAEEFMRVAKMILSEDGLGHDWYFDDYITPHRVVDELDEANITSLKDIIFKEIGDKELSLEDYDSDFFSELSEEQGTEGYFRIKAQDLNGLVSDESAFNELCKNDLDDLGSSLRSLYWQAENSAYEDEVYELVYGGLEEYFEGRISEVPREVTRTDGSKITRYDQYIKIRNFPNIIKEFFFGRVHGGAAFLK